MPKNTIQEGGKHTAGNTVVTCQTIHLSSITSQMLASNIYKDLAQYLMLLKPVLNTEKKINNKRSSGISYLSSAAFNSLHIE